MSDDEEAIMAADDPGYLSPIDGHMHYAIAARDECAICRLETERDRLRAVAGTVVAIWECVKYEHGEIYISTDLFAALVTAARNALNGTEAGDL